MKTITSRELSMKWGISQRRIVRLASDGKICGAKQYGRSWMFPEDSEKPADGRTRECKTEKKPEPFRYPIFEHKDLSSFDPPLSDEEQTIKTVTEAFNACRFQEADTLLGNLSERTENRYIRITALYCGCVTQIALCDAERFLDDYGKLKAELQEDFPYKAEMSEYIHEIDNVLGSDGYYSGDFHERSAYRYHESFLPRLCNLSALRLAFGNSKIRPADLTSCEINCVFLEKTDNWFDLQALHVYLACAYSMADRDVECRYHFIRALELAEKYDLFYMIASTQYYYTSRMLEEALQSFPEDFKNKVAECNRVVRESYVRFTNALRFNSIYKILKTDDFIYLIYAVQGLSNKEIAKRMHKSTGTVGKRYSGIYASLGVKSKAEMVSFYRGFTSIPDVSVKAEAVQGQDL